jgi:hypothetical protein
MTTHIEFDPTKYPQRILILIMRKAEEWKCHPSEALAKLFDSLADEAGIPATPNQGSKAA